MTAVDAAEDTRASGSVRDRILTLGRQTVVYGVAGVAAQAVGVFTLPIFARTFAASQYGVLEIATVGYSAMLIIADGGLAAAAQRSYYDYGDAQEAERRTALLTGLAASMALALTVAAVLLLLARPISHLVFGTPEHAVIVRIVGATIPLGTLGTFCREIMRMKLRPWLFTVSALLSSAGAAVLAIVAVLALDAGVDGVLYATLIGAAAAAVYGVAVDRRHLAGRFSRPELRRMLAYGLPLLPAAGALWGLNFVDRVLLARLGSLADTGQYAVANRFALVPMLLVTAFYLAYGPFQLSLWREDEALEKRVRNELLTYLTLVLTCVSVALALFAREIASVIAPGYDRAYEAVGLLGMSVTLWGIANVAAFAIIVRRATRYVAVFTLATLAVNVGLNVALIPLWGMVGAAVANLASYALLATLYYRRSQRLYPTRYELARPVKTLAAGALAMTVGALPLGTSAASVAARLGTLLAFAAAIRLLRVIDERELLELRVLARRLSGAVPARGS